MLNGGKIAIRVVAFDQGAGNDFVFAEQALVRLNANGTLDTTFHGDGIAVVSAGTSDVTWNPDGSAFASRQVGETVEVRAITVAGTRNDAFSEDGRLNVPCPSAYAGLNHLRVNQAGQPLLSCLVNVIDHLGAYTLQLTRFTAAGDPDATYGTDGQTYLNTGGIAEPVLFETTPSGAVWMATAVMDDFTDFRVYSIDENGDPNPNWGTIPGSSQTNLSFGADLNRLAIGGGRVWVAVQKSLTVTAIVTLVP